MDALQNPYILSVIDQPTARSARLGDPQHVVVGMNVVGMLQDSIMQLTADENLTLDQTVPSLVIAALQSAGWGTFGCDLIDASDTVEVYFTLDWNCANGITDTVLNNVAAGMHEALASVFARIDGVYFVQDDLNQCQTIGSGVSNPNITNPLGAGATTGIVPHPTTTGTPPANTNVTPKPPVTATGAQSWFDKNFFNGAGSLTGIGIGAIVLIGAFVLSKNK